MPMKRGAARRLWERLASAALATGLVLSSEAVGRPAGADAGSEPQTAHDARSYGVHDRTLFLPAAVRRAPGRDPGPGVFGFQISEDRFREPAMIQAIADAGGQWWRTFLFWDEVELRRTSPPTYDWRLYDPLFAEASGRSLAVIAEIQGNPRWVSDFPGGPPRDLDALAQFVAAAAERYDGDGYRDAPGSPIVRYWELYNEPDNVDAQLAVDGRGWGYWGFEGAEYARMLKRVYPAVKIANPAAVVVFGGVAYDAFIPNDGPFNPRFVDDVLAAGGGPFFDVMNFHYYPLFAGNWAAYGIGIAGKAAAVREKLSEYGLEKPLFVTEAGSWSHASPPYPATTPEEQARYVAQVHARALAADIRVVCWFQYDDVAGVDDPARGLVDRHLRAKPALTAYRVTSSMLAGARPIGREAAGGAEVYWFDRPQGPVAVAWSNDGAIRSLAVSAPSAERTRVMGTAIVVRDDADGVVDGVTHVPYGSEPVFVVPLHGAR